ncbi:MAG: hypothetical protein AB1540_07360 [Bdellovibrionota bacterium]
MLKQQQMNLNFLKSPVGAALGIGALYFLWRSGQKFYQSRTNNPNLKLDLVERAEDVSKESHKHFDRGATLAEHLIHHRTEHKVD